MTRLAFPFPGPVRAGGWLVEAGWGTAGVVTEGPAVNPDRDGLDLAVDGANPVVGAAIAVDPADTTVWDDGAIVDPVLDADPGLDTATDPA
ncbi:hypothetical protein GN958_ATG23508 [Phytophthora infestans]|uniref:Uncharacterized protein n=1 Tax=Phytophthora infestans TaxID=4787 RepID=A0A8S9TKS7_PHYIN|nr:hypothetical protein GN958_ATG23508 [Phytophthora infestans]